MDAKNTAGGDGCFVAVMSAAEQGHRPCAIKGIPN